MAGAPFSEQVALRMLEKTASPRWGGRAGQTEESKIGGRSSTRAPHGFKLGNLQAASFHLRNTHCGSLGHGSVRRSTVGRHTSNLVCLAARHIPIVDDNGQIGHAIGRIPPIALNSAPARSPAHTPAGRRRRPTRASGASRFEQQQRCRHRTPRRRVAAGPAAQGAAAPTHHLAGPAAGRRAPRPGRPAPHR